MTKAKNFLERLPKLWIENSVNQRVEAGVDVSKECCSLESKVSRRSVEIVLDTQSIQDVTSEERNPAHQECRCKS